jgi:hypothetical protein
MNFSWFALQYDGSYQLDRENPYLLFGFYGHERGETLAEKFAGYQSFLNNFLDFFLIIFQQLAWFLMLLVFVGNNKIETYK